MELKVITYEESRLDFFRQKRDMEVKRYEQFVKSKSLAELQRYYEVYEKVGIRKWKQLNLKDVRFVGEKPRYISGWKHIRKLVTRKKIFPKVLNIFEK